MSRSFAAVLAFCSVLAAALPLRAEWMANGAVVTKGVDFSIDYQVVLDGTGGIYITWSGPGGYDEEIFLQKVDADGNYEWWTSGIEVVLEFGIQMSPRLIPDGSGGVIIAWQDYRDDNADIYAQRVDADGNNVWTSIAVPVCTASLDQMEPNIVSDGEGGAVIIWLDTRSGVRTDIYAQRIDSLGNVQWAADGLAVCTASGSRYNHRVIKDGAGGAIIAWEDTRAGNSDIYAQRLSAKGEVQWTVDGVSVCAVPATQTETSIVSDGAGGAVVLWRDWRNGNCDIYAQRYNGSGSAQWTGNGVPVCIAGSDQLSLAAASDGAAGAIVVWYETGPNQYDLFAQRIDAAGAIQWAAEGIEICTKTGDQMAAQLVPDGSGGSVVVWQDARAGDSDIYTQRIDAEGNVLWKTDGAVVCTETYAMGPRIVSVDADTVIVLWRDYRLSDYDLYAQKLNGDGRVSFLTPEIISIDDIGGDQGGWVRVHVRAPGNDSDEMSYYPTTGYNVWRRIRSTVGLAGNADIRPIHGDDRKGAAVPAYCPTAGRVLASEEAAHLGLPPGEWESIGVHPAIQEPEYYFLVPTNNDSTASGVPWEEYVVTAHISEPRLFFVSDSDSGYSVDDLAPAQPQGFAGNQSISPQGLRLSWLPNAESDISHYAVHRGDDESFIADETSRIGTTADTVLIDLDWIPTDSYYYKLAAVDVHDNMGADVMLRPEDINVATLLQSFATACEGSTVLVTWTLAEEGADMRFIVSRGRAGGGAFQELVDPRIIRDGLTFNLIDSDCEPGERYRYRVEVEDERDRRILFETDEIAVPALPLTLYQNHPNPFNPATTIEYYLPDRAQVTLEIFSIAGRRIVCLADGERGKGLHRVEWNGTDENGNEVSSGMYLYRLRAGKRSISKKLILLK